MKKPVWMESWGTDEFAVLYRDRPELSPPEERIGCLGESVIVHDSSVARARLAAAAPALVRALLYVEWITDRDGETVCSLCDDNPHDVGYCEVDAALSAAGFPDQASRDEARRAMAR